MADKDKKEESLLDIATGYGHLRNPFYSISTVPAKGVKRAPGGKWAFSDNESLNTGLWNALGVASWAIPTAALAAYFANKWWDKKMRESAAKSRLSRLAAVNPRLTPDADLSYIANVIDDPNRESEAVDMLLKNSNEADKSTESIGDKARGWFGGVLSASLPMAALPLSILAAKLAVDKMYSNSLERRLENERNKIRNIQNAVDYRTMVVQGLVKKPSQQLQPGTLTELVKEATEKSDKELHVERAAKELERREKKEESTRSALNHYLSWPILTAVLGGGALSMLAFKYLRDHDKDTKILEYIKKKSLGHNVMQTTPEIGLEQFGIPVNQIVARPGDKNQPIYELASQLATEEQPAKAAVPIETSVSPESLDMLEEVGGDSVETKKSDALF